MDSLMLARRYPPHHLSPARAITRQGMTKGVCSSDVTRSNALSSPESQSFLSKIVAR
jgi:hypothetical protein